MFSRAARNRLLSSRAVEAFGVSAPLGPSVSPCACPPPSCAVDVDGCLAGHPLDLESLGCYPFFFVVSPWQPWLLDLAYPHLFFEDVLWRFIFHFLEKGMFTVCCHLLRLAVALLAPGPLLATCCKINIIVVR